MQSFYPEYRKLLLDMINELDSIAKETAAEDHWDAMLPTITKYLA